ncbi:MAG: hypothetical protein H9W81_06375 [Enterococcus sp.]|nr:hypothetical protein [Enterococcus sp.]
MIFGAKTLYSANTNIDALFENGDLGDRTGAISLVQKEGRKTINSGKIYFRKNFVYAVEIDEHPIPIAKRVATGGLVDYDELNEICRVAGSYSSQRVVDLLLERQLISEKQLNIYIKEHFLGLMEEILSWENCEGTWIPDVSTKNFVMPYVPIHKIRSIIDNRKKYRNGFTKSVQSFFVKEEIPNLTFVVTKKSSEGLNNEFAAVLGFATGENTVAQIAEKTGLNTFNTLQAIVGLWQDGNIDIQLGGIKLPYASLIKKVNTDSEQEQPKEEYKEETISIDETPAPAIEEPVIEENHDEEIILQKGGIENTDYTLPNSTADMIEEVTEPVTSEDTFENDEATDDDYLITEEDETPQELLDIIHEAEITLHPQANYSTEDKVFSPVQEDLTVAEDFTAEPAEDNYEMEPAREVAEEFVPTESTSKENMPTNTTLRSSKLQELTARLTELQGNVAHLEESVVSAETSWNEAETDVTRLEEELSKARERRDSLKEAHDNIAVEYEIACNEVTKLIASFQIGG